MSQHVTMRVRKYASPDATASYAARVLLYTIADVAREADGVAWPSNELLRDETGIEARYLRKLIGKLTHSGDLYVERGQGRGHRSTYFVTSGFDEETVSDVLQRRFEMPPEEADQTASAILEKRSSRTPLEQNKRGSPKPLFDEEKRVTKPSIKPRKEGQQDPVSGVKGVFSFPRYTSSPRLLLSKGSSKPETLEASPPSEIAAAAAASSYKSVIEKLVGELTTLGLAESDARPLAELGPELVRRNAELFCRRVAANVRAGREPPGLGLLVDAIREDYAGRDEATKRLAIEAALREASEDPGAALLTHAEAVEIFDKIGGTWHERFETVKQPPNRDGSPGSALFRRRTSGEVTTLQGALDEITASVAEVTPPPLLGAATGKRPKAENPKHHASHGSHNPS